MEAKILEIFHSIQGEGQYIGLPQVFVRFFECNMHCAWCDTPHSIGDTNRNYTAYSLKEVSDQINSLWANAHAVSLTGGEPLLQTDFLKELLPVLKKENKLSYLETNGTLPKQLAEVIDDIDIVAMDIKLPSSTRCRPFWKEHEEFLRIAKNKDVFIKTVISSGTDRQDILDAIDLVTKIDPGILFILQPNYFEMKNGAIKKCLEFQNDCSKKMGNVRIVPQVHKFMKLR